MVLAQKQKHRPIEQDREPRDKLTLPMSNLVLTKEARIYNGAKIASSISGVWKIGQLCAKE